MIHTIGELLHVSYANLAMAHAAVSHGCDRYGPTHYMIRGRLLKGLRDGTMRIGPLADDARLNMVLPQACCYCAEAGRLSADHLLPLKRGGPHAGDNLVWACRSCNSSKGATDVLEWLAKREQFPPLLLLRRYLKLAVEFCRVARLMDCLLDEAPPLPFSPSAIPTSYPPPASLSLWIIPLPTDAPDALAEG